jgi:hypothetical protein
VVNTFKNLGYSGDRLFPVKTNYSEFTFRIWISNSTSIDRILSISKDSAGEFQGNLIEFGKLFNGKHYKDYYKDIKITPISGYATFKQRLDSLELLTLQNKADIDIIEHEPISTYVVEIKQKNLFNTFRFDTYYPKKTEIKDKYRQIESLIFDEFNLQEYNKFKPNGS